MSVLSIVLRKILLSIVMLTAVPVSATPSQHKTIGISQIIQHAALDTVRNSMVETLKEEGFEPGKNLTVISENAQGTMALSSQIATKLIGMGVDVAIGISTPSAQTLLRAAQNENKKNPIVFTAVTDPAGANLTTKLASYPITGVTDAPDLAALLEVFDKLLPNVKKIGILYNPSESNSVITVTRLKDLLKQKGIIVIETTVNTTADVSQATQSLIGKVEAIYFPQDNTVVSAMEAVKNAVHQSGVSLPIMLPIYSEDPKVMKGVLAAVGYDYRDVGRETGKVVARILKGEAAENIPIQHPKQMKVLINEAILKKLNLTLPGSLKHSNVEVKNFD